MSSSGGSEELTDKFAIQELIVRYSDAVTRGDWDEFESVWTPDAQWIEGPPIDMMVRGARAIAEHVRGPIDNMDFFIQVTQGAVITLLGRDRASARTHLRAIGKYMTHEFVNYGIYYDDLLKTDGSWRFSGRHLQLIYTEPGPLPGHAVVSRADIR